VSRTLLLDSQQVRQRINRLAWQIFEDNPDEKEIIIVGILQSGNQVAEMLADALRSVSPVIVTSATIRIDKHSQVAGAAELSIAPETLSGKVVVLVDDVLNSGKTLLYAMRPFLAIDLVKLRTVVLVDRNHRRYPISADYAGHTLATTLKEHITVEGEKGALSAYLD
jgi:pyrimidine operon attenuation protein/uracil phosphoribosyltransferase